MNYTQKIQTAAGRDDLRRFFLICGQWAYQSSFAFNASLTSVNIARAFARQQGMDLSVGSTKTLLRGIAVVILINQKIT